MNEIYAFWGGEGIYQNLNAVVRVLGTGDYAGLARSLAIVALLGAVTWGGLAQKAMTSVSTLLGICLVWMVLLVPKQTVIVNDVRTAQTWTVSNVPVGLAVPYSALSTLGYWLTTSYETNFGLVNDERFSTNGMVFGARLSEILAEQTLPSILRQDVESFYEYCLIPEFTDSTTSYKFAELRDSKDVFNTLTASGFLNPALGFRASEVSTSASGFISCADFPVALQNYFQTEQIANQGFLSIGRAANIGTDLAASAIAGEVESDVSNMLANYTSMSQDATELLAHLMTINSLVGTSQKIATVNGYGDATMAAYGAASMDAASRQNAYFGKMWAEKALPLMRNVGEIILIALFPIVLLMVMASGEKALMVFKVYLTLLLSLCLWAPLAAVLNGVVVSHGMEIANAQALDQAGLTISNLNAFISTNLDTQALAGQLFLLIPIIAYSLATGATMAMTSAVQSMTAAASSTAQQQSHAMSQGNFSGGQVSWGNMSAFNTSAGQQNTAFSQKEGMFSYESAGGSTVMSQGTNGGYSQTTGTTIRGSSLGNTSLSSSENAAVAFQQSAAQSFQTARQALSETASTLQSMFSSGFRDETAFSLMKQAQKAVASGDDSAVTRASKDLYNHTTSGAFEQSATNYSSNRSENGLAVGGQSGVSTAGKGGGGLGMGTNASASFLTSNAVEDKAGQQTKAGIDGKSGQNAEYGNSYTDKTSNTKTATIGQTNSEGHSTFSGGQVASVKSSAQRASAAASQGEQAMQTATALRQQGMSSQDNLADQVIAGQGGGMQAVQNAGANKPAFDQTVSQAAQAAVRGSQFAPKGSQGDLTAAQVSDQYEGIKGNASRQTAGAPAEAKAPSSGPSGTIGSRSGSGSATSHGGDKLSEARELSFDGISQEAANKRSTTRQTTDTEAGDTARAAIKENARAAEEVGDRREAQAPLLEKIFGPKRDK